MDMTSHGLMIVGLDFHRAPTAVREAWMIDDGALERIHREARSAGVSELVVIRTCNRTELVVWAPSDRCPDPQQLVELWSRGVGRPVQHPSPGILARGAAAEQHLLRIACGLESQVLGDIHILGQLRRCYREATERESVGPNLHRLFAAAFRSGKRVRSQTSLMAGHASVGSEAARFLASQLQGPSPRRVVVVGTGKVGSHAARTLASLPDVEVVTLNRTPERAIELAREWGGDSGGLDRLPAEVARATGLVVATGATRAWVDAALLSERSDSDPPLAIVDLSMPRNVAIDVEGLPGVRRWDLDEIHPEAARVESARREAIPTCERIIDEELATFRSWLADADARQALQPLRDWIVEICRREVSYVSSKDADAERAANRIAAKVLARPMVALRSATSEPGHRSSSPNGATDPELLSSALIQLFSHDTSANARSS